VPLLERFGPFVKHKVSREPTGHDVRKPTITDTEIVLNHPYMTHDTTDDDTLGGRISRARESMDLTTAQLARRLGVKTETVQAWENDRSEPRSNRFIMLAGLLGVTPTWLLTGTGDTRAGPAMHSEVRVLRTHLAKLRRSHVSVGKLIDSLEKEADRISQLLDEE